MLKTVYEPAEGFLFCGVRCDDVFVCVRLIAAVGDHSPLVHIPSVA